MSKYYKAEDVIERLAGQWHYEATIECPYAADDIEEWKQNARELYADLPTIEVSEGNQVLYETDHNCILTMFGECSYNETGCGSCAVAEKIRKALSVEVSEDCISKHDIWKIIEDNAYWVRYNGNSAEKGMTLTGINQALNECPPVIPTVSEDCISRA